MKRTALVAFVAGSAAAQPDLLITVDNFSGDDWRISAEFLSPLPRPADLLGQHWSDTNFDLSGDGSTITITSYNTSYDNGVVNAQITNGPTASFRGFANQFFGVALLDPSNPLFVAEFSYAGAFEAVQLDLVGFNAAYYFVLPFSGEFLEYQDADGNPGELTWGVQYIPGPATLAAAPFALLAARRRRN